MRGAAADRVGVLRAVDHDSVPEVECVLAEVTFDLALGRVGRRDGLVILHERPVRFRPYRVHHFSQHLQMPLGRVKHPDFAPMLQQLAGARGCRRLVHQLRVAEQVELVAGDVDGDHHSGARSAVGEAFHEIVLLIAAAELPPMATRVGVYNRRGGRASGGSDTVIGLGGANRRHSRAAARSARHGQSVLGEENGSEEEETAGDEAACKAIGSELQRHSPSQELNDFARRNLCEIDAIFE